MTPHLLVGPWGARFRGRAFPCAVGRGGIGVKRAEGDGITPVGRHRIEAVLSRAGRVHNPCTTHAQTVRMNICERFIRRGDGWCDDPADPAYNRAVRLPHPGRCEILFRPDPLYDRIGVLDWNRAPVVPGRGSAIFLHVWRQPRHPTAGCIAFRRRDLDWILARWTRASRVVVGAGAG